MTHRVEVFEALEPATAWGDELTALLDQRAGEGWTLVNVYERTVTIEQTGGMSASQRTERETVLIFSKE